MPRPIPSPGGRSGMARRAVIIACLTLSLPAAAGLAAYSWVPPVLTPRDAFDPRFRLACTLYNDGLSRCLRVAQKNHRLDARRELILARADGGTDRLPVVQTGFAWRAEDFGQLDFT